MIFTIGNKIHRLTIIGTPICLDKKHSVVAARCDCGTEWMPRCDSILRGTTKSCGCLKVEVTKLRMTTHGQSPRSGKTKAYGSYNDMLQRCYNPNQLAYKYYGGRGITVCPSWYESFENFYADMGDRPKGKTLDRIDNSLRYSKDNCRWATHSEQMSNTRGTKLVIMNGEKIPVIEVARRLNIPWARIYGRVHKYKVTHQEAADYYINRTPRQDTIFVRSQDDIMSCANTERKLGLYLGAINDKVRRKGISHQEAVDFFITRKEGKLK